MANQKQPVEHSGGEQSKRADTSGWWRRLGSKDSGFYFKDREGAKVVAASALQRIKLLVIPPAWRDVLISPSATSPLQVIGFDALGRKQYLYHPEFRAGQEKKKFGKLRSFGAHLSKLRRRVSSHLFTRRFSKPHVLAIIVRLIHDLYLRVGTEKSVKMYKTFGVTTLRKEHLKVRRAKNGKRYIEFAFVGKHHVEHERRVTSRRLVKDLAGLSRLPNKHLFQYYDTHGELHPIKPDDVNSYIKSISDKDFTAKDFRTWGATLLCAVALAEQGIARNITDRKKKIVAAVKSVAMKLGNTPSVCRSSYIHPGVIDAYEQGLTVEKYLGNNKPGTKQETDESALLKLLSRKHQ